MKLAVQIILFDIKLKTLSDFLPLPSGGIPMLVVTKQPGRRNSLLVESNGSSVFEEIHSLN